MTIRVDKVRIDRRNASFVANLNLESEEVKISSFLGFISVEG